LLPVCCRFARGEHFLIRKIILAAAAAGVLGLAAVWFLTIPKTISPGALGPHRPDLANGKTMFLAGGCSSCHADVKEDRMRLGGGAGINSPFGTFYAPNISPDPKDGIGGWSEAEFVTAMVEGTSPQGEHLYPAFPYTSYRHMTIGDLRDLFAYLATLPKVAGRARDHVLKFPFNIRRAVGLWKLLFLDGAGFPPDAARSAQWNRGAYLVNGPGHCGECHTPRNVLGAPITSERFNGGPSPNQQGGVPSITQQKLRDWSEADIAEVLASGETPDSDRVGGSMVDVVRNTSQLTADDRAAMAAYIKSLPAPAVRR
jgi:mono/diheme cytochrome c family protein